MESYEIQLETSENKKGTQKAKRRISIDEFVEVVPLKNMKLVDVRTFNDKITKFMVPYTYGYDGSIKAMKKSKIGNRRISEWNIENLHASSEHVDAVSTIQKSNVENESHHYNHEAVFVELQSNIATQSVACKEMSHNVETISASQSKAGEENKNADQNETINSVELMSCTYTETNHESEYADRNVDNDMITHDSLEFDYSLTNSPVNDIINFDDPILFEPEREAPQKQPKPASVMHRRRSARLSMSRDKLGSLFFEAENECETQAETNENRSSEKQPPNIRNNVVSSVPAETNITLRNNISPNSEMQPQNTLRKSVSQLLARSNDDVQLWQTKKNSISDPLFYCFDLVEKTNANTIKVTCLLCESKNEPLTCKIGNNSNLKAHLNRKHKTLYDELKSVYNEQNLTDSTDKYEAKKDEIQDLILKFIIKERLPLQKVESEHLNRLIDYCLNGKKEQSKESKCFLTRKVARRKIKNLSLQQRTKIKNRLKSIKYISATSDVWTSSNRSYIAVSVHYIAPENGKIATKFIACERFLGSHNHVAVAQKLKSIFNKYEIEEKVKFITTDGAGEYKCAMVRFGDNYQSLIPLLDSSEDDSVIDNDSLIEEEISEVVAIPVHEYDHTHYEENTVSAFTVNEVSTESCDTLLPTRVDCSAHFLDKIGKVDSFAAVLNEDYCDIYTKVMDKLNLIWNVTQSRLKLELFEKYAECKLVKPHRIRWNKLYDAIERILDMEKVKLKAACTIVSIPILDSEDYEFLSEYMDVIRPIALALKILEGNREPFGSYLPTLFGLKFKLDGLGKKRYKFCKPLLQNIVNGFNTRFSGVMDLSNPKSIPLYMAMVSNPTFKLNYMPLNTPMHVLKKIQNMLLKAAEELVSEEKADSSEENCTESATIANKRAGMIFTDKRRKMTDELFEDLLLLHMNDWE